MAADWPIWRIADLVENGALQIGDGYRANNAELAEHGLPFARAGNIHNGFRFDNADRVPPATVERVGDKRSRPGDVVFTSKGTVGRFAFVRDETEPFVFSPQLCFWRSLDRRLIDPVFLYCWVRGAECTGQLNVLKGQTDMADYVSLRDQRGMSVKLPPEREQRAIASVLAALDDKISSNQCTVDSAQALLRSAVPRHGALTPLSSVARFKNGGALTKFANGAGRPVLRIKELRSGVTISTPRTDTDVRADHEVFFGNLLFSWSGTLLTCRWSGEAAVLNQHVFRVDPLDGYPTWLVEAWVARHLPAFRQIAADKTTTMGHIQRHHLDDAIVVVPAPEALRDLDVAWTPLDEMRMGLVAETASLTDLRDVLLPKLVSGQIRVPLSDDPDEMLGAAVEAHEVQEAA